MLLKFKDSLYFKLLFNLILALLFLIIYEDNQIILEIPLHNRFFGINLIIFYLRHKLFIN